MTPARFWRLGSTHPAAPVVLRHGRGVREKRRDEGTPKVVVASSVGGGGVRCNGGGSRRSSDSGEGVRDVGR